MSATPKGATIGFITRMGTIDNLHPALNGRKIDDVVRAVNTVERAREALTLAHRMLLQTSWRDEDGALLNEIEAVLAAMEGRD